MLASVSAWAAPVEISEVDSSTVQILGDTEGFQFIELRGTPGDALNGLTLALINGSDDRIYKTVSLDGFRIGTNGFFTVGNSGVPQVDLVVPPVTVERVGFLHAENTDFIQPGPDAVVLYRSVGAAVFRPADFIAAAAGQFPLGKLLTEMLTPGSGQVVEDALVYASFAAAPGESIIDVDLTTLLGRTQQDENGRGQRLQDSLIRTGATTWAVGAPSPGGTNLGAAVTNRLFVEVTLPGLTVVESAAGPIKARVRLHNPAGTDVPAAAATPVTVTLTDVSELSFAGGAAALTTSIPSGGVVSADFDLFPVNDGWREAVGAVDGSQFAFIHAASSALGVGAHTCWVKVTEEAVATDTVPVLSITEVNGYPTSLPVAVLGADANGDGLVNDGDRFIEIVNTGTGVLDVSGFAVATNAGTVHTFPPCSLVWPGQAVVLMKSGVGQQGITMNFSGAQAYNVNGAQMVGVNAAGQPVGLDSVRVLNASGVEVAGYNYGAVEGGSSGVQARFGHRWVTPGVGELAQQPLSGQGATPLSTAPSVPLLAYGAARPLSSPGAMVSGASFFTAEPPVGLITCASVAELSGPGAGSITVTRPAGPLLVQPAVVCVSLCQMTAGGRKRALVVTNAGADLSAGDPLCQTYRVEIGAGVATATLMLATNPCDGPGGARTPVDGVQEVYSLKAVSCLYQNTVSSTPASVTVMEPSATVAVSPAVVFDAAGSVTLQITLPAPAPVALTFDVYGADLDKATAGNAVFNPTLPCLANPAALGVASSPGGDARLPSSSLGAAGMGSALIGELVVPAGATTASRSVTVSAAADLLGNRFVRLTAIARCAAGAVPTSFNGLGHLKVVQPIVINEISTVAVDANGDGVVDAGDRFIEVVYNGTGTVNLAGHTLELADGTVLHAFPACSELCAPLGAAQPMVNAAAVVFGGGNVEEGITALAASAVVQRASSGGLSLVPGAVVRLKNGMTILDEFTFAGFASGSTTRRDSVHADGLGLVAAVAHDVACPPATASAGRSCWGTALQAVTETLAVSYSALCIPELWSLPFMSQTATLTVTRSGPTTAAASICLQNLAPLAARLGGESVTGLSTVVIPAGAASVTVSTLKPVDNVPGNGNLTARFRALAGCYRNGAGDLLVRDSGGVTASLRCSQVAQFAGAGASTIFLDGAAPSAAVSQAVMVIEPGPVSFDLNMDEKTLTPALVGMAVGPFPGVRGAAALNVDSAVGPSGATQAQRVVVFHDAAGGCENTLVTITTTRQAGVSDFQVPRINEIDYLTPGGGNGLSFVEIKTDSPNVNLSAYRLAVIDGVTGNVVSVHQLGTTSGSFYLVGHPSALGTTRTGRLAVPDFMLPASGAVGVYLGAPVVGAAATCDLLIDAVVYGAAGSGLSLRLTPGSPAADADGLPIALQPLVVERADAQCAAARVPDANATTILRESSAYAPGLSRTPGYLNTTPIGSFLGWTDQFAGLSNRALASDEDADGLTLLAEYAFGTNPTTRSGAPVPVIGASSILGAPFPALRAGLTVPVNPAALCDARLRIEAERSADLLTWTLVPPAVSGASPLVFAVDPIAGARFFMRTKVTFLP